MATARFTGVTEKRPILDLVGWDRDPVAEDKHLHASGAKPVGCGSAIGRVTTTGTPIVDQM